MADVAIVDYGLGNLFSIQNACTQAGLSAEITGDPRDLDRAKAIILPGMGAFGDAMDYLKKLDLIAPVKDFVKSGRPFLGVCLGMQLLMTESEEFGIHKGLDLISGTVRRFQFTDNHKIKVPQVGWNAIYSPNNNSWENSLFREVAPRTPMYFVHSYYVVPERNDAVLSLSDYEGVVYCSGLMMKNITATQFHPERSASPGLTIYKQWAAQISKES